jgi:hypothetical protein
MTALVKRIEIDSEMEQILRDSRIEPIVGSQGFKLVLPEQLERTLYERIMKILAAEGGKWNRQAKGHLFTHDPRERLGIALDAGELNVEKEGWFPTPAGIVWQMLDLEPSAGEGDIAQAIRHRWEEAELYLLCIEKNAQRAQSLRDKGLSTLQADFLSYPLPAVFTRMWMNPPFHSGQDITHTMHAYSLLAPGGKLVGIMSAGPFFREDRQATQFRDWLSDEKSPQIWNLPDDAFKESGTSVKTRMIYLEREG